MRALIYGAAILAPVITHAADGGRVSAPQNLVLQGIQITDNSDNFIIEIEFGTTLHYVRHFPFASGSNLQIQLQPPQTNTRPAELSPRNLNQRPADPSVPTPAQTPRERLDSPHHQSLPLTDIIYESDVAGRAYLTLRFKNNVEFTVTEGLHGRSMIITVIKKEFGKLSSKVEPRGVSPSPHLPDPLSDKLDNLIDAALSAMEDRDYNRAIFFLAKLLQFPVHKHSQLAKELVGLARERRGDLDRAALEYHEYLRLYPDGSGSERVKQRLAAVELSQKAPREPVKAEIGEPVVITSNNPPPELIPAPVQAPVHIDTYGSFSQRYDNSMTRRPTPYLRDHHVSLTSLLNVTSSYNDNLYDGRAFVNLNDTRTFHGSGLNKLSVQTLYLDLTDKDNKRNYLLGRQSSNTGGIFGRYDGGSATMDVASKTQLNLTLGAPLDFTFPKYPAQRYFYRTLINLGAPADAWSGDGYYLDQQANGLIDRRTVGGDLRWSSKESSLFTSLNYDIYFHKLNLFSLYGDWRRNDPTHYSLNYSLRQYPLLASSNALTEEDGTLDDFSSFSTFIDLPGVTKKLIRDKAAGVSSFTRSLTLSVIHTLDANNSINADVSVYSTDAKPAILLVGPKPVKNHPTCDGISYCTEVQPKFGPEYSYALTWMTNNYFTERDSHSWGARHTNGGDASSQSLWIRSRFPYGAKWYINPRAQFDRSHDVLANAYSLRPSVGTKVDYLWKKEMSLDADISYEYNKSTKDTEDYSRAKINFSYNVNF